MADMDVNRSLGTTLGIGKTNPVTVARLSSINGLELSADTIDVTTLESEGGYREFIAGFKDAGEVALEGYFVPTVGKGQKELYDLFESGADEDYTIQFPNNIAKWDFKGVVTGFATGASLEDPLSFSATVKVSGKPALTTGTMPTISPKTATFDINSEGQNYKDLAFTVSVSGDTVSVIEVLIGANELAAENYTAIGGTVTVKKEYLKDLATGDHTLTIKTDKGNVTATITVEDTTD